MKVKSKLLKDFIEGFNGNVRVVFDSELRALRRTKK